MLARVARAREERGLTVDSNCYGTGPTLEKWGNLPEVKAALHVNPNIEWSLCSNNGTFQYSPDIPDERTEIYPTLTKLAGYQVLIYNGEADLCVPFTDNEWWVRSMNYTVVSPWHAWAVAGEEGEYVGGYATVYDNNFTFATVRGAGCVLLLCKQVPAFCTPTSHTHTHARHSHTHTNALTRNQQSHGAFSHFSLFFSPMHVVPTHIHTHTQHPHPQVPETRSEAAFTLLKRHITGKGF